MIRKVTIHNIMGVKDIELNLEGHHLFLIGGRNGQGKTSAIRALIMALCGRNGCKFPNEPLKSGEDEGWVRVEMDGDKDIFQNQLIVERRFERRENGTLREKLRIIGDNGFEAPSPQKLLNDLYRTRGIDPISFLEMKPEDQAKELQRVVGIDTSDLERKRDAAYSQRTDVNKTVRNYEARLQTMSRHEDVPPGEVSVVALMNERKKAEQVNRERDAVIRRSNKAAEESELLAEKKQECLSNASDLKDRIRDLQEQIKKAELEIVQEEHQASVYSEQSVECAKRSREILDTELVDEIDLEPIDEQIRNAETVNRKVRENQQVAELEKELAVARSESAKLTDRIDEIDAERRRMIEEADWPIESLRFEDGKVFYRGVVLSDCSTAEQVTISTIMSMKMNPKVRLLTIQRGESMDDETLSVIEEIAKNHDYQLLIERVTRNEDEDSLCQVVFEDGSMKG